ncbi:alpha-xenorhabdolysin family binary toxin subunit A [Pseudomonas sp. Pseusp122]|uniref:alpha-xenorhabdolysin family binary toxin subunit A n=1 Tax=unclassified Pseudomonas TaxID=196821 RepID=UPI0039A55BF8
MMSMINPSLDHPEVRGFDEVSEATKNYLDLLSGKESESERDPGLLITNEDVRRIRRYVKAGLELPTDLEEVRQLLNNQNSNIKGLEAEDIQVLYQGINTHARSWAPIESDMKEVGSDLNVFAGNLITTGQEMIQFITSLESYQQRKVGDLTPDEIDRLPPVDMLPDDHKKIPALLSLVDELKGYVKEHSDSTQRVKSSISTFKDMLKNDIAPSVNLKIQLIASGNTNEVLALLNSEIALLNERIQQKIKEYEEYSKFKWLGFWWGPIGGGISYSIWGPKAAQANRDKEALMAQKRQLEIQVEQINRLSAALLKLETDMQDLQIRMEGAASSVSNLESLWVLLDELVDSSYRRFEGITNAMYLVSFVSRFKTVIANWEDIKKQSWDLLTAFNNALDEKDA